MREQSIADSIELKCMRCFGTNSVETFEMLGGILTGDAIRKNLMYSLSIFLVRYYKNGDNEYDKRVDKFLEKYREFFNKSIDEIGEDLSDKIVNEFSYILKNVKNK